MLCARQRLTEPLLYMSAYFDRNRQQYVDLLLRVSTHGAWRDWVAFFVQGVNECAQDGLRLADELLALRDRYHAAVRTSRASGHLATLIDHLFRVPSITIGQARELLGVTAASASYNLRKLVALGIVQEVTGRTRDQVFVAREILGFVGRDLSAPTQG